MKKAILVLAAALGLATTAGAQSIALDYAAAVDNTAITGGGAVNSMDIDLTNDVFVLAQYGTAGKLLFYNLADGTVASPASTDFAYAGTAGLLAGFGVGANNGEVFLYNQSADPSGDIEKLDSITDTTGAIVLSANTGNTPAYASFSRNMTVVGSGDNTYILNTGAADFGAIQVYKSTDASRDTFQFVGELTGTGLTPAGAGKAGAGASEPEAGQPPLYITGGEAAGGMDTTRVFKLTGTFPTDSEMGYTHFADSEAGRDSFQSQVDLGTETHEFPVVLALERPTDIANIAAEIALYRLDETPAPALVEVGRAYIPLNTVGAGNGVVDRASLRIDRDTNTAYFHWRLATPSTTSIIGKVSYTQFVATDAEGWTFYE